MTPEQTAVSSDLHWLIHQGHVIEFSNGKMELPKNQRCNLKSPRPSPSPRPMWIPVRRYLHQTVPQAQPEAPTPVTAAEATPVERPSNEGPSTEAVETAEERAASSGRSSDKADISTPQLLLQVPRSLRIAKAIIPSQVHLKDLLTMRPMNHRPQNAE